MAWGTLQVSDSLAALAQAANRTVAEFGVREVYEIIREDMRLHNELVLRELIPDLCAITDQREGVYGSRDDMTVEEIDEFGRPDVQKVGAPAVMGFPLSSYGRSVQWTFDYMQTATVGELAEQYQAMRVADLKGIKFNIQTRMFTPTNNTTYLDRKLDNRNLTLRAFHNADSTQVWTGPNGETFDGSTHTHYTGIATLTGAAVTALITNVLEHGTTGELVLYINAAQEAAVRGFTASGEFTPYVDARIVQPQTATYAQGANLDLMNPGDRPIGIFGAAQVWVKPWIPANYMAVIDKGMGNMKPLAFRTRPNGALADWGFRKRVDSESFPLYAETLARDYGIGVWHRHMAAFLRTNNATYSAPTFS